MFSDESLRYIKKRPGTKVGTPGRFQGVNIGVLMLDLDGIRASDTYEYLLSRDGVEEMVYKYDFTIGQLGDQDWFTMVSIEAEELVYPLVGPYQNGQLILRRLIPIF